MNTKYTNADAWEKAVKDIWFGKAKALGGKVTFIATGHGSYLAKFDCDIANLTIGRWKDSQGVIFDEMGKEIG